jgi:endonuclease YncB( thermonuclease family)
MSKTSKTTRIIEKAQKLMAEGEYQAARRLLVPIQDQEGVRPLLEQLDQIPTETYLEQVAPAPSGKYYSDEPRFNFGGLATLVWVVLAIAFLVIIVYLDRLSREEQGRNDALLQLTLNALTPLAGTPGTIPALDGTVVGTPVITAETTTENMIQETPGSGMVSTPSDSGSVDATSIPANGEVRGVVVRIINTDTFEVQIGSEVRQVVYNNITGPSETARCYQQAMDFQSNLLMNKEVRLQTTRADEVRLYADVWVDDVFVNEFLIKMGYAVPIPSETQPVSDTFNTALVDARRLLVGCHRNGGFSGSIPINPVGTTAVCELRDCRDFRSRQELDQYLSVCPDDLYKFEKDGDGIACSTRGDYVGLAP